MNVKSKLKDDISVAESILCSERLWHLASEPLGTEYLGALLFYLLFGQLGGAVQKMDPSCNKHMFDVDVHNFCGY